MEDSRPRARGRTAHRRGKLAEICSIDFSDRAAPPDRPASQKPLRRGSGPKTTEGPSRPQSSHSGAPVARKGHAEARAVPDGSDEHEPLVNKPLEREFIERFEAKLTPGGAGAVSSR